MQNKQTPSKPLVVMLLAGLCCLLWGSAIPFINLGYRYFGVSAGRNARGNADSLWRLPLLSGGLSDDSV